MRKLEAIKESLGFRGKDSTVGSIIESYATAIEKARERIATGKAYVIDTGPDGDAITTDAGFIQIWGEIVESLQTDGRVALRLLTGQRNTYASRLTQLRKGIVAPGPQEHGGTAQTPEVYINNMVGYDRQIRTIARHFHLKYPKIPEDGAPPQDILTRSTTWGMRTAASVLGVAVGCGIASQFVPVEQLISQYQIPVMVFASAFLSPAIFARRLWKKAHDFTAKDAVLNNMAIKLS